MIILVHVVIALTSLVSTSWLVVSPSPLGFRLNYGLLTLTLLSGMVLVVKAPANLASACISGLAYLGISALGIMIAKRRHEA